MEAGGRGEQWCSYNSGSAWNHRKYLKLDWKMHPIFLLVQYIPSDDGLETLQIVYASCQEISTAMDSFKLDYKCSLFLRSLSFLQYILQDDRPLIKMYIMVFKCDPFSLINYGNWEKCFHWNVKIKSEMPLSFILRFVTSCHVR